MVKNATMTATANGIVTKLVKKEAAIKRENRLAPEALLIAMKGGTDGRGGKVGKSPKRDKRDNKDDRKEKDFRKCAHCQRQGHTTDNCLRKQRSDPPRAANTTAKTSTETTSTLTTSIENYSMVASSTASSSDWFIDCRCTTHISGGQSIIITYTEYPPDRKMMKGYIGVTSFASGYGSVRLICQLRDGRTETIILQEVVHLLGSFNLITQSQIMDKDIKVEPVNNYSLNRSNPHGKLITTALEVEGLFVLDRVLDQESTKYTDIDDSCLLALETAGHASRQDAEKRMLWHRLLAHVGLKTLEIMPTIPNVPKMTGYCDCETWIKSKLARKLFTPITSRACEHLQLVHLDICGPLETVIARG